MRYVGPMALAVFSLSAAAANTYVVDSAHSSVSAYTPTWVNAGPAGGGFYVVGEPAPPTTYQWRLDWMLTPFAVSGTFDAEIVNSPTNPGVQRLLISNAQLATGAPAYAGFGLPNYLTLRPDGSLMHSGHPCYDDGFYAVPGITTSCSGWSMGPQREDTGSLSGGAVTLSGGQSSWIMGMWVESPVEPPPVTDFSPVAGYFAYSVQAAVPEPETWLSLLAGLGIVAGVGRRRIAARARR